MELQDLLAPVVGETGVDDALESWRWLIPTPVKPFVATAFGDLFVLDDVQAVWFLDIQMGTFDRVADSTEAWEASLHDPEFVDRHFSTALVMELRESGMSLAQGECYEPTREPIFGGSWLPGNWSPGCWVFRLERQGRVHFAIKDLPEGAVITKWNYTEI
jgi:hypothetical protein